MNCRLLVVAALVASLPMPAPFAADAADPLPAEYAIRWDIAGGGPQSVADTAARLGLKGGDVDAFEVRYFTVGAPPNLPPGFGAVIRERQKTNRKKYELTYKVRGPAPLPATPALAHWACPVGATDEKKDELDVSFLGQSDVARNYSRSCTVESAKAAPVVPPGLAATPAACTSTMTRLKFKKITVEEWHLPGGRTVIEVSQSGTSRPGDLDEFRDRIVKVLVDQHRITPIESGMTQMGSACAK